MATAQLTTWPTIDRVNDVIRAADDATHELEVLGLECYGLAGRDTPYEPVEGVTEPTLHDVGVLARLVQRVEHEIEQQQNHLETFKALTDAAVYRATDNGAER